MCGETTMTALSAELTARNSLRFRISHTCPAGRIFPRLRRSIKNGLTTFSREAAIMEILALLSFRKAGRTLFLTRTFRSKFCGNRDEARCYNALPQSMSVDRFSTGATRKAVHTPDRGSADPKAAMENYRECLKVINSRENYDKFANSGFSPM